MMMDINRELDTIFEDGRFNRIRSLFKKKKESTGPQSKPEAEKGFFGASDRRSFLKKTGKAATGAILPLQHLGLNPVTIKAVTDTLSGHISNRPITAEIKKRWSPRPTGVPMIDNGLLNLQNMWHQITRLTDNPIEMLCGYGFRSKISPNLVASIVQQIAKGSGNKIKIGNEQFTISDNLKLSQGNVVGSIANEINAIKLSWSEEGKENDREHYNHILRYYENRLAKAEELSKTAKYDFYLNSEGGTRIHITDLPAELSCDVGGSDLTQCGKDFSKAVLAWWDRSNTPFTISKRAAEYLDKMGAKPKQFNTWEEYAEAARKSEKDMMSRQKEFSGSDEEPEEVRHSPDSMETMRGTSLQYPYDESFDRKLNKVLFNE
jgi:hypothetical protein